MYKHFIFPAHSSGVGGRRSIPGLSRILSGRFSCHAIHRVQRRQGHLPLLRQQVQLLADHRGSRSGVPVLADTGDTEGRPGEIQSQPLPGLQQALVGGKIRKHLMEREHTERWNVNHRLSLHSTPSKFIFYFLSQF